MFDIFSVIFVTNFLFTIYLIILVHKLDSKYFNSIVNFMNNEAQRVNHFVADLEHKYSKETKTEVKPEVTFSSTVPTCEPNKS